MRALSLLLPASVLALAVTGCSQIRYAVEDSDVPVAFGQSLVRPVGAESRQWYGVASLINWNDQFAVLGKPLPAALAKVQRKSGSASGVVVSRIDEEQGVLDIAFQSLSGALSTLTLGASTAIVSGSRTATVKASEAK